MPAFSFTAPHVTPEQEREEEASLSDEMRRKIHNDLYGFEQVQHPNPKEGRPGTADESLVGLYEAIEMLPMQQKKEYMEALKQAPKLVQTESDPIMFLRCENFNCEVRVFIQGLCGPFSVHEDQSNSHNETYDIFSLTGSGSSACILLENPAKFFWRASSIPSYDFVWGPGGR